MRHYPFDHVSGLFSGLEIVGDADFVAANTPPGMGVWSTDGAVPDALRHKVIKGALIEYQPAKPADSDDVEWVWRADVWRWMPQETAAMQLSRRKSAAAADALAEIAAAESSQARPMREILDALLLGGVPPAPAVSRFEAIKADIEVSRSKHAAILAADTVVALDAIESQ